MVKVVAFNVEISFIEDPESQKRVDNLIASM